MERDNADDTTLGLPALAIFRGLYNRVARKLGVDPSYVSRVARGERRSPDILAALEDEMLIIREHLNTHLNGKVHINNHLNGKVHVDGNLRSDGQFTEGKFTDGQSHHDGAALADGKANRLASSSGPSRAKKAAPPTS